MRIRLMGDVAVMAGDGEERRLQGLQPRLCLALLARERSRLVGREEIAHLLWGDDLPQHWQGAVRGVVTKVRAFLREAGLDGALAGDRGRWRLVLPAGVTVDVEEAEAVGGERAVALLEGEFVPGAGGPWVDRQRAALDGLLRQSLLEVAWEQGPARLDAARRLVEVDPFDEAARRLLMAIEAELGDRKAALDTYRDLCRLLEVELDVAPEPETVALAASIDGRGDVEPVAPSPMWVPIPPNPAGPLVGREAELSLLLGVWDEVRREGGLRLVAVEGEAGVGKTRLALALVARAGRSVMWGRCGADQVVAYEPVLEALGRALATDRRAITALGPLVSDLSAVLPELAGDLPADRPSGDDAVVRTRLFRAMAAAAAAVVREPVVWVVDDLHWAAADTLAMLRHLVERLAAEPVLLVVTMRHASASVAGTLAELARLVPTTTVALSGLDERGVLALLQLGPRQGGPERGIPQPDAIDAGAVAAAVRERTGGNPFLVKQVAELAAEEGRLDPMAVPSASRVWIQRRVAALPRLHAHVLGAAAVLGGDIDLPLLAASSEVSERDLLDVCDELVAQRFLSDNGRLEFAHALVRDAVYESMRPSRRAALHERIAAVLAQSPPSPGRAAALARHLSLAGESSRGAAGEAFLAAGQEALGQAAWESAATSFRRAIDLAVDRGPALVGLGRALRGAGRRADARAAFEQALELGRAAGAARLVADAALGLVGGGARGVADDLPDAERAALLREALDGLGAGDDDLAVPLHGELALALLLTPHVAEREALAEAGLARARANGDPALLAQSLLWARIAHVGPEHAEVRLRETAELLSLPASARTPELTMAALLQRHEDLLLTGEREAARQALADAAVVLERYPHPYWRWAIETWHALGEIVDGRLEEAERRATEALSAQAGHPEALACLLVNMVNIRLLQGRAGEVVDVLGAATAANPHIPCYRAVLALCLMEAGAPEEASDHLSVFAAARFENIPPDTNRLLALAVLADVAAAVGNAEAADALLPLLHLHRGRQVVLNCFGGGGAWWGAVDDHVARLEEVVVDAARR